MNNFVCKIKKYRYTYRALDLVRNGIISVEFFDFFGTLSSGVISKHVQGSSIGVFLSPKIHRLSGIDKNVKLMS